MIADFEAQVVRSLLKRPEEGTGSIERQSAQAKALVMLAKVHKVSLHLPFLLCNECSASS